MGRHEVPLSDKERERIVRAIESGVPLRVLVRSGRFAMVSEKTIRRLANEAGIERRRHRPRTTE